MHLGSLNLGRLAGRVDDAVVSSVGRSIGRAARRTAGRGMRAATSFGGRAAVAGMGLGLSVGAAAAVGAVGVAYGASRAFNASLNAPSFRVGEGGLPSIERGGNLLTWAKHGKIPLTNRHMYSPMLSSRLSDMIGAGGVTAGIVGGIQQANRGQHYTVSMSPQTDTLEIERDSLLGATGSLTLAMYNQRHGRPNRLAQHRYAVEQAHQQSAPISTAVMHMAQPEIAHALHMAHMAALG